MLGKTVTRSRMHGAISASASIGASGQVGVSIDTRLYHAHTTNVNSVAYFSMEIGVSPSIPTYAGGLGVLAGDALRAAADLGAPMVGVTLLYREGYFEQHLTESGKQIEMPDSWNPAEHLEKLPHRVAVTIEGREVQIAAWRYTVEGVRGDTIEVLFLDTDLEANSPWDRSLTDKLYDGDEHYRLCQEAVLGLGGIALLRELEMDAPTVYHMNEGHSALLALALLEQRIGSSGPDGITDDDVEAVRHQCVFTTHTPVPAGHDKFALPLVQQVLGDQRMAILKAADGFHDNKLNMTYLALRFSRYINGVALRHEEISQGMFPEYPIHCITNGVHAGTWVSEPFAELYDEHIPDWRYDNEYLRYAGGIPLDEIQEAHTQAKSALLQEAQVQTGCPLDQTILTIGFARRATSYKRADLLFADLERLRHICQQCAGLQVIYAGKAHPEDQGGKEMIQDVFRAAQTLESVMPIVYLPDYGMESAKLMCAGVDVWLNTPLKPHEASGTSGMKAALNGVPQFSVLDGWWLEGHLEGITGWAIGSNGDTPSDEAEEATSLYDKLEHVIMPLYYERPLDFAEVMRQAIVFNGSFFNSQRMLSQYMRSAYHLAASNNS